MAYIVGILFEKEEIELINRGWKIEDAPKELIADGHEYDSGRMRMVWVDTSMFDIMNGPDWDKG
jgi:hypothetical protein